MTIFTLLAGPTASGKSALAIAIAEARGAIVVNADSMQVYADLRVLSARPSEADEARITHRLYGFVPAHEEFSVGRYLEAARPLIAETLAGGQPLVFVGGTGLYFRALTEGLVPTPAIPAPIRRFWRLRAGAGHDLHAELVQRDPDRAAMLHPADTPRLLRAIELHAATGRPYSAWLADNPGTPLLPPGLWRGAFLDPPRPALNNAIDSRFRTMMAEGAEKEVAGLLAHEPPLPPNLGIMKAHGVPHLVEWKRGRLPREEAIARGQGDTRRYARRQVIFARRYLAGEGWRWFASAGECQAAWLADLP